MATKPDQFRNRSDHPVPLASGRVLAPGEDGPADIKTDHDKALVAEGLLIKADPSEKEDSK